MAMRDAAHKSTSPRDAVHTSPRGLQVPAVNIGAFLFANPFHGASAPAVSTAPHASQRAHFLAQRVPPHRTLYVNPTTGAQASWARVWRDAGRVARGLRALPFLQPAAASGAGVGGEKIVVSPIVMVHLPNCVVYGPVLFGVWMAGLTASTVNPFRASSLCFIIRPTARPLKRMDVAVTKGELAHVLRLSKPQAIVTLAGAPLQALRDAVDTLEDAALRRHYQSAGCIFVVDPEEDDYGATARPRVEHRIPGWDVTVRNWKALLAEGDEEWEVAPMSERESKARIALVMWSSGTSGKSKGASDASQYLLGVPPLNDARVRRRRGVALRARRADDCALARQYRVWA